MRFDVHVHSNYSDGLNSPAEIVEYARSIGLNGVAVTDHNTVSGSEIALEYGSKDFLVIPGMEVSALEGHIVCLGSIKFSQEFLEKVKSNTPPNAREVIDVIHDLGGIAIAAHPYDLYRGGVGDLVCKLDFDAMEVRNGHTFGDRKDPMKVAQEVGLPMVGGSDAHSLREIGNVALVLDGNPLEEIKAGRVRIESASKSKFVVNHVNTLVRRLL